MFEFDPLALDVLNELNELNSTVGANKHIDASVTWEHEDLAQVL